MMYLFRTLEIKGYLEKPLSNTLLWQKDKAKELAIILPGIGYTCHMPLLYYPSKALLALGVDVLWVEYNYIRLPDFRMISDAEQNRWIYEDVAGAYRTALAERSYHQVMLIGKSLGTRGMAQLLTNDASVAKCKDVWLTPVLRDNNVREQLRSRQRALVVIGTADPYYDPKYFRELQATNPSEVMVVESADHNMETEGDFEHSLSILEKVTRAIRTFASLPRTDQPD